MNIKRPKHPLKKLFSNVVLACPESGLSVLILLHLLFIYLGGYFLSPEFTVYPYLVSAGLKPYINIIDQHLPLLFFGSFSLPSILTRNPQPLLSLFLSLLALSDLLFFLNLKKNKVKRIYFWLALFILSQFISSGNILWLETFITPLVLLLLLLKNDNDLNQSLIGLVAALIIFLRPALIFTILLIFIIKKIHFSRSIIAGLLIPALTTLAYLIYQQSIPQFSYLLLDFNAHYYKVLAAKTANLRQVLLMGLLTLPPLISLIRSKKFLPLLLISSAFLPLWPRFGFEHILPALALAIYFWATNTSIRHPAKLSLREISRIRFWASRNDKKILLIILLILSLKKIITVNYGNFYLTSEVQEVSNFIKAKNENELFVLGGSDLIYPLSGKTPAGDYYLPSLPWYYQNQRFVDRQLQALRLNPDALVVINTASAIDGRLLKDFAKPVYQRILDKYTKIQTIGSFAVYGLR